MEYRCSAFTSLMSEFQSFLSSIYAAVLRKNGHVLAKLIGLPLALTKPPSNLLVVVDKMATIDVASQCNTQFRDVNIAGFVKHTLLSIRCVTQNDFEQCKLPNEVKYSCDRFI